MAGVVVVSVAVIAVESIAVVAVLAVAIVVVVIVVAAVVVVAVVAVAVFDVRCVVAVVVVAVVPVVQTSASYFQTEITIREKSPNWSRETETKFRAETSRKSFCDKPWKSSFQQVLSSNPGAGNISSCRLKKLSKFNNGDDSIGLESPSGRRNQN